MHPIEPEELMAYLDGEIAPEGAAEHLSHCRECQAVAADLQSVSRHLLEWQVEEPALRVKSLPEAERAPQATRPIWLRRVVWAGGLAAVCIALLVGVQVQTRALRVTGRQPYSVNGTEIPQGSLDLEENYGTVLKTRVPPAKPLPGRIYNTESPFLVRTSRIVLTTPAFTKARTSLEDILKRHGGHLAGLTINSSADSGQVLQSTLRVPATQLDAVMAEIRKLGRVETEQQGGEEVTQQMIDLQARLANAQHTEQRLVDILSRSTGKIADVLAVEKEIDRVRGEIERMEAEHKGLTDRIAFASLDVIINEEYQARLGGASSSTFGRLRNSAVEGFRLVGGSLTAVGISVLTYGPAVVLWAALLFFPVRYAWHRLRPRDRI
jgi:hypothetical protein